MTLAASCLKQRRREVREALLFTDVLFSVADGIGFWDAMAAGIFCTLGTGCVDFGGLARALDARGFDGWATVEQDRDPRGAGHPLADAVASRRFLEDIGLSGISTTKVSM